jgi:glycosyltransferase involved in cell wall biosynthesis
MVVPCYNKEKYIGAMLDSVYRQVWDNIELILVNDGSTDGTRDIIAEWEPKLRARGYEVVIVDQENGGCCAAVYAGLLRMTGEYYCLVECDEEIMPVYGSRMAGWLSAHERYEWAACSYQSFVNMGETIEARPFVRYPIPQDTDQMLENYILRRIITMVWIYMARTRYVKHCGMIENFCTERSVTYEPLVAIPLIAGGGKLKFFEEPLYKYNMFASDLYKFDRFEKAVKYYDDYLYLYNWSIHRLDVDLNEQKRLYDIARLAYKKELFGQITIVPDGENYLDSVTDSTLLLIDALFDPPPRVPRETLKSTGYYTFFIALEDCILGIKKEYPVQFSERRIIAYGVFGKVAKHLLPMLKGSAAEPSIYWDAASNHVSETDGVPVTAPDFASLSANDAILVFPRKDEIYNEVCARCGNAVVIDSKTVAEICCRYKYSAFYERSSFRPDKEA